MIIVSWNNKLPNTQADMGIQICVIGTKWDGKLNEREAQEDKRQGNRANTTQEEDNQESA